VDEKSKTTEGYLDVRGWDLARRTGAKRTTEGYVLEGTMTERVTSSS
jgi:hypothetical protein